MGIVRAVSITKNRLRPSTPNAMLNISQSENSLTICIPTFEGSNSIHIIILI
ncbi:hypothetical protein GCM10010129_83060 [Streptomyces fumigatiscleroticus]|nr:hypothetical protein GCM10010129_83060 [Streptomyces fumigatiscleroticus]